MPGGHYLWVIGMKRFFAGVAAAFLAASLVFPCSAISASSSVLLDGQTGRLLYSKQADKQSLIASTTKIMTALVVCEQVNVLDRVRIPKEAVGIEGSSMYLKEGEILTVQELLYGLMLHSGNDAAVAADQKVELVSQFFFKLLYKIRAAAADHTELVAGCPPVPDGLQLFLVNAPVVEGAVKITADKLHSCTHP